MLNRLIAFIILHRVQLGVVRGASRQCGRKPSFQAAFRRFAHPIWGPASRLPSSGSKRTRFHLSSRARTPGRSRADLPAPSSSTIHSTCSWLIADARQAAANAPNRRGGRQGGAPAAARPASSSAPISSATPPGKVFRDGSALATARSFRFLLEVIAHARAADRRQDVRCSSTAPGAIASRSGSTRARIRLRAKGRCRRLLEVFVASFDPRSCAQCTRAARPGASYAATAAG